jgi:two-component system phosphate regulon response regulator PhoB
MDELVLVVEDEPPVQELLRYAMQLAAFPVVCASTLKQGFDMACELSPSVILVDWQLAQESGLSLVRMLRALPQMREVAIIMVTCRDLEHDKVMAFECGVDDYLTKPFSPRELASRVKAVRRRVVTMSAEKALVVGPLRINPDSQRASIDGRVLQLRPKEFRLLLFLARSRGRIFSRAQLLEQVWDMGTDMGDRTVDAYIQRLRSVLKQAGQEKMIETVRGMGYCLSETHP